MILAHNHCMVYGLTAVLILFSKKGSHISMGSSLNPECIFVVCLSFCTCRIFLKFYLFRDRA